MLPEVLAIALEAANIGMLDYRFATRETTWSSAITNILGMDPHEQPSLDVYIACVHPDERERVAATFRDPEAHAGRMIHLEHRILRNDGKTRWVCLQGRILSADNDTGKGPRLVACIADITETRLRQTQAPESEARLRAILAIAPSAIISIDRNQKITVFNDAAEKLFGYDRSEVIGRDLELLIPHRYRDAHRSNVESFWFSRETSRKMGERQEVAGLRKDESEFPADASISKIAIGTERIFTVVLEDITERKETAKQAKELNRILEQRVAERTRALELEMKRREDAQKQLIQSQRMEAFGQLTGGVAHDFNNLLAIVTGSLELMEPDIKEAYLREHLQRAANAADMGARLTSRLLTFARHKVLEPVTLNLNDQVNSLLEILHRTLGEQIMLRTSLTGDLWPTRIDPSEAENAILNLTLNARDAMPDGGQLLIETSNVTIDTAGASEIKGMIPGEFVLLSISDTGTGMAPEVLSQVFEPFFTTKGAARGSGLGLSTIYGFAKQSGGAVAIYSEQGEGTTVNLYLPRADMQIIDKMQSAPKTEIAFSRHNETILVVEDNPAVRETTLQRIEGLGYVVMEAASGPEAIEVITKEADIALVLTDVVMAGGMSGFDLGRWIRENHTDIQVLLTSGFAPEMMDNKTETRFQFLRKPFNRTELASALSRQLYDAD